MVSPSRVSRCVIAATAIHHCVFSAPAGVGRHTSPTDQEPVARLVTMHCVMQTDRLASPVMRLCLALSPSQTVTHSPAPRTATAADQSAGKVVNTVIACGDTPVIRVGSGDKPTDGQELTVTIPSVPAALFLRDSADLSGTGPGCDSSLMAMLMTASGVVPSLALRIRLRSA